MQLNAVGTSIVNGALLGLGTVASSPIAAPIIPWWLQWLSIGMTVAYGALQLIKAMPWFTDQSIALWRGIRHGDWSRWWKIAGRDEEGESKK